MSFVLNYEYFIPIIYGVKLLLEKKVRETPFFVELFVIYTSKKWRQVFIEKKMEEMPLVLELLIIYTNNKWK